MLAARPHTAEATTNTAAETWNSSLRPNWSPNLPASTVAMVSASRYDDTTQDRCPAPPRSPTMVGSAVDDDGLVERGQQHPDQDRDEHQVHPPAVQRLRLHRALLQDRGHPHLPRSVASGVRLPAPPVVHASARFAQRPQNMIVLNVSVWWKPTLA